MPVDNTRRFSSRVKDYTRSRPSYPVQVVDVLKNECGLAPAHVIADIGSGTGLLSELFLTKGHAVYGVEPNAEMRQAAEDLLSDYPHFVSIDATAESTTLADASIDYITAGQSFHWFDLELTRVEWKRILRKDGWVVLVWNERRESSSPFHLSYERLLQNYGVDYHTTRHRRITTEMIHAFYGHEQVGTAELENYQYLDFQALKSRLLSSSYTPEPGHANYRPMMDRLATLFEAHEREGMVQFEYDTRMYYGHLSSG